MTPEASKRHSHTTLLHSTTYATADRAGARAGSSQTRWCTQVTGLTRQAAAPVRAKATPTAAPRGTSAIGSMHSAAKGGYVKPYGVPGSR
jgi:hypothetical protein